MGGLFSFCLFECMVYQIHGPKYNRFLDPDSVLWRVVIQKWISSFRGQWKCHLFWKPFWFLNTGDNLHSLMLLWNCGVVTVIVAGIFSLKSASRQQLNLIVSEFCTTLSTLHCFRRTQSGHSASFSSVGRVCWSDPNYEKHSLCFFKPTQHCLHTHRESLVTIVINF